MKHILSYLFLLSILNTTSYAQVQTIKHVTANGGSIKTVGVYSTVSVIGEMAVSRFSSNTFSGTIGYLNDDDALVMGINKTKIGETDIRIFPNPSKGKFTLQIIFLGNADAKIILIDVLGRVAVQRSEKLQSGENNYGFNNISAGVWFMKITTGEITVTKKVLIEM